MTAATDGSDGQVLRPGTALAIARELLILVRSRHEEILERFPDAFEVDSTREEHDALISACGHAEDRLRSPTLSIALMGTTSSGKSTLVNGLVGRRIAPIEAGEMSAGVLRVVSTDTSRLTISSLVHGRDGGSSTAEELSGGRDEDHYLAIQAVMHDYHQRRRSGPADAPEVTEEGPMVSTSDPSCLNFPDGVSLELIDLPGLKSVSDRASLDVIQQLVGRSFSLVTLDYRQVDEDHRARLLEELKDVVRGMGGSDALMAFVLNGVDLRSRDDRDLQERIDLLALEIQNALGLRDTPVIVPMSARLLYWAQCSWGPSPLAGDPASPPELRVWCMARLLEECASDIHRIRREDPSTRGLLTRIQDAVDDEQAPTVDDHRALVALARANSGADVLWRLLNNRLSDSFAEVVIMPAVMDVLQAHTRLVGALATYAEAHEQESLQDVARRCAELDAEHERLQRALSAQRRHLQGKLDKAASLIRSGEYRDQLRLQTLLGTGAINLTDAVNDVGTQLRERVVEPLTNAYAGRATLAATREDLAERGYLPPHLVARISDDIDALRTAQQNLSLAAEDATHRTWRARQSRPEECQALEALARALHALKIDAVQGLQHSAEMLMQQQADRLKSGVMQMLLQQQRATVNDVLTVSGAMGSVGRQVVAESDLSLTPASLTLPQALFEASIPLESRDVSVEEKTGTRKKKVKRGFWFIKWTKKITVDVVETVHYQELQVPSQQHFEDLWIDAVRGTREDLAGALVDFSGWALSEAHRTFEMHIEKIMDAAKEYLRQRTHELNGESNSARHSRRELDEAVDHAQRQTRKLKLLAAGPDGGPREH